MMGITLLSEPAVAGGDINKIQLINLIQNSWTFQSFMIETNTKTDKTIHSPS